MWEWLFGESETRETYFGKVIESSRLNRDTVRFPGFKENDEEFLNHQKDVQKLCEMLTNVVSYLASFVGLSQAVGFVLKVANSNIFDSSIKHSMIELKIEMTVVEAVHTLVSAEMSTIVRQMKLFNDQQASHDTKKTYLAIADNTCYNLLVKFCDNGFYLRKYPFVFSPFFVSFVAVYVPITVANYKINKTKIMQEECLKNLNTLQDTISYFRKEAVKQRLLYIRQIYTTGFEETIPYITDDFLQEMQIIYHQPTRSHDIFVDVYDWYCKKVARKYEAYYEPVFEALNIAKTMVSD